jgi:hypothetical protein
MKYHLLSAQKQFEVVLSTSLELPVQYEHPLDTFWSEQWLKEYLAILCKDFINDSKDLLDTARGLYKLKGIDTPDIDQIRFKFTTSEARKTIFGLCNQNSPEFVLEDMSELLLSSLSSLNQGVENLISSCRTHGIISGELMKKHVEVIKRLSSESVMWLLAAKNTLMDQGEDLYGGNWSEVNKNVDLIQAQDLTRSSVW